MVLKNRKCSQCCAILSSSFELVGGVRVGRGLELGSGGVGVGGVGVGGWGHGCGVGRLESMTLELELGGGVRELGSGALGSGVGVGRGVVVGLKLP